MQLFLVFCVYHVKYIFYSKLINIVMKKMTLILAGFFMFGMVAFAQVTPFTISGRITNPQSVPSIGQIVYIESDSIPLGYYFDSILNTDCNGYYTITIQPPSGYLIYYNIRIFDCQHQFHQLTVQNDSVTKIVNFSICLPVAATCNASYSYNDYKVNYKLIHFADYSSGNIKTWHWNFGDGTTSTLQHPQHLFQDTGTYTVCLTVSDNKCCVDSFCYDVKIYPDTTTSACSTWFTYTINKKNVTFQAHNNDSSSTVNYDWGFGDQSYGTGQNPTHIYKSNNTFNVCLYASVINSNHDTTCRAYYCGYIKINPDFSDSCSTGYTYTVLNQNVTFHAYHSDSTSTIQYNWDFGDQTTGTGQNPTHTYPTKTNYHACVTATSINNHNDTCTAHYCESLNFYFSNGYISGTVSGGNYMVDHAIVYLIYYNPNDSTLTAIDTAYAWDSAGIAYYYFRFMPAGNYLVKAALTSASTDFAHLMPTYYGNKLFWHQATNINITYQNYSHQTDILMINGTNPGGPGFIGGKTSQGANIWATGDPLSNIQVLLLDQSDNPVACQYSKSTGDFGFNSIAYGTYKIYAEVLGKTTFPATVTIDASKPSANNVKIIIGSKEITNSVIDQLSPIVKSVGNVYPNPAYGNVQLEIYVLKPCKADIQITNSLGQVVQNYNINLGTGSNFNFINTDKLLNGLYNIKLSFSDGSQIAKPLMLLK
jgi:PKD repeat protein